VWAWAADDCTGGVEALERHCQCLALLQLLLQVCLVGKR
jgi:hypothetical protein